MAITQDKKKQKIFEAYIKERKIVIADSNATSRAGIARAISNMGAKSIHTKLAESYAVAEKLILELRPHIVISDFELGKACGLNLLQEQRATRPESKDCLFVLVTGNTSQSAVAQAAEEDVDSFILKPYTLDTFRNCLINAALMKIQPSDYVKTIEEGKKLLLDGKPDEAIPIFEKAMTMDPKPALACFYNGQAELIKEVHDTAKGKYKKGLDYNKIHYKCLVGLFELLMKEKMFQEAYDAMKKVSQYFPANPKRLASVIRLAVMTNKVEDMERYYQVFTNLETRDEETTRYICAGLIVCAKYYMRTRNKARALELLKKAAVSSGGNVKFLREITTTLVDASLNKEAQSYIARFDAEDQKGPDFKVSQFYVSSYGAALGVVIENGRGLIKEGIKDALVYKVLIKASVQAGQDDTAEELMREAVGAYEAQKSIFEKAKADGKEFKGNQKFEP